LSDIISNCFEVGGGGMLEEGKKVDERMNRSINYNELK
jgi:hypothetical protein